jgi:hypothetical protein
MTALGEAPFAMFWGKLNTPPPIIEPMTSPANGNNPNLRVASLAELRIGMLIAFAIFLLLRFEEVSRVDP